MDTDAPTPLLCLASASPRRRELLTQIGVAHLIAHPDVDERVHPDEAPTEYAVRMARTKAQAVRARDAKLPVLAADTIVVLDETICGKPANAADGVAMLQRLSGRTHTVLTAVALAVGDGEPALRLSTSQVRFRALSQSECAAYWDTGEPRDKAGGYAIQGRAASFIEHLSGSYSGVMGLPLFETAQLLRAAGLPWGLPDGARGAAP